MSYGKFASMMVISFCIMYGVMFLNVDDIDHIYLSTTRMYMSLLMVSPMALLMMAMMKGMYPEQKINRMIMAGAVLVFALADFAQNTNADWRPAIHAGHDPAPLFGDNDQLACKSS